MPANMVMVSGRVVESRQYDGRHYTTVRTPAPDPFTSPGNVEIASPAALGSPGSDVEVLCNVGGYVERFKRNDGGDGSRVHMRLRAAA